MKLKDGSKGKDEVKMGLGLEFKEKSPMRGHVALHIVDEKTGEERDIDLGENTITVAGDKIVADAMSDRGETLPSHMGAGSTSGGKTTASNALEAQLGSRKVLTSTTQGAGADDNDVIYVCTFAAGEATGAWVELGLMNHASAGDMALYQEFSVINKSASMSITITWTWTYGAS